jgi:hypothetical protein
MVMLKSLSLKELTPISKASSRSLMGLRELITAITIAILLTIQQYCQQFCWIISNIAGNMLI